MTTYKDEEGNEVEAFTQDEVNAKIEEASKANKVETDTKIGEFQTQLDDANKDKKDLEKKLEEGGKGDDKDKNFGNLRGLLEKANEKIEGLEKEMKETKEGVNTKFDEKKIDDAINSLAGGDKELADKIRLHYNTYKLNPEDDTPEKQAEAFKQRVESAYILATGNKPQDALTGNVVSAGGGGFARPGGGDKGKLSEGAKQVGGVMGVSEDDIKKADEFNKKGQKI